MREPILGSGHGGRLRAARSERGTLAPGAPAERVLLIAAATANDDDRQTRCCRSIEMLAASIGNNDDA